MELLLDLLCLCLLCLTEKTLSDKKGPAVITVEEGADVVLPCSLSTKENIEFKLFDWRKVAQKDDGLKEVFLYDGGSHYNNGLDGQSEEFKGRVSHFQDELKHGNASIIIRNTKISDSGEYTCYFPRLQPPQIFYIELVVVVEPPSGFTGWMIGLIVAVVILLLLLLAAVVLAVLVHKGYITLNCNKVITVEEGSDVTLPCSLWPKKDLRSEVFIWQKTDSLQMVFLYDNGDLYSDKLGGQNEQFKGRVSHFPDELEQGNASIIITNTTRADNGYYTCIVSSIQKKEKKKKPQIFNIKLDVVVGSTRKKEHRSLMI